MLALELLWFKASTKLHIGDRCYVAGKTLLGGASRAHPTRSSLRKAFLRAAALPDLDIPQFPHPAGQGPQPEATEMDRSDLRHARVHVAV